MDTILVVDDEKKMRHILQLMLEREGFKTEQAENGKEALGMLQKKEFGVSEYDDNKLMIKRLITTQSSRSEPLPAGDGPCRRF